MSLAIDTDDVTGVLLSDGKWYTLVRRSFDLDAYEFVWDRGGGERLSHGGGADGICATGFKFETAEGTVAGPLTSIVAVRFRRRK